MAIPSLDNSTACLSMLVSNSDYLHTIRANTVHRRKRKPRKENRARAIFGQQPSFRRFLQVIEDHDALLKEMLLVFG